MGRKSSTPSSLNFEESDQNDSLMKQIFENVKDVPDKELLSEKTAEHISTNKPRASGRDSLKRPDDEIDLHGKTRDEAIKIVQKFVIDCYQKNLRSALIITGKGHHSVEKDPANDCLDSAIITDPKSRTKKTIDKLRIVAGRVLKKK